MAARSNATEIKELLVVPQVDTTSNTTSTTTGATSTTTGATSRVSGHTNKTAELVLEKNAIKRDSQRGRYYGTRVGVHYWLLVAYVK